MRSLQAFFIIFLFLNSQVIAQIDEFSGENGRLIRLEIETREDSEPYKIVSFGTQGVLVFYESIATTDDKDHNLWVFKLYDINLKEIWAQELPVIKGLDFKDYDYANGELYLIFYNEEKSYQDKNFELILVPGPEGLIRAKTGRIDDKSELTHFMMADTCAILACMNQSDQAKITIFFINSGNQKEIIINPSGVGLILDIHVDTSLMESSVLYKYYNETEGESIFIETFDQGWSSTGKIKIENDAVRYYINQGEYIPVDHSKGLVIGTYRDNPKDKYSLDAFDMDMASTGFMVSRIDHDTCEFTKYYNFSEFQNFYKNLSVNDLSRIRKVEKKSDEFTIDYNLIVHPVKKAIDQYVFIAEAYFPEYHTVTRMMYDWYGRPMPSYYNVFDGYRYTSAFVAGFDQDGNLLWDNGLELWDILSNRIDRRVNVIFDKKDIILAYLNNAEIVYKVIQANDNIESVEYVPVDFYFSRDKLISESGANLIYWYNNYFMSYGYQKIKNNNLADQSKRSVFYINKIAFN